MKQGECNATCITAHDLSDGAPVLIKLGRSHLRPKDLVEVQVNDVVREIRAKARAHPS